MHRAAPHRPWPLAVLLLSAALSAQHAPGLDLALARQAFEEARQRCADDAGRLWGRDLHGPLLLADPASRTLVANVPDPAGTRLLPREGVFAGALPDDLIVANTAVDWEGRRWTLLAWPLPAQAVPRARLLLHELFHAAQAELGFPAANAACGHLDTLEGRIWLQLEWRALAEALHAARRVLLDGARADAGRALAARDRAVADALLFRRARRLALPGAEAPERALELNEGLAEYTGIKLRGTTDADSLLLLSARLPERAAALPAYARSFAYESGPALGLLLDQLADGWRARLTAADDLGELAGAAAGARLPDDAQALLAEARTRARAHGGDELRAAEEQREARRLADLARWRARLVDGPVLVLPLGPALNYGFDPNEVLTLEGHGSLYPTATLHDAWGDLQVDGAGLLLAADFSAARVAGPAGAADDRGQVAGAGWSLRLAPGWSLAPGPRPGDATLRRD